MKTLVFPGFPHVVRTLMFPRFPHVMMRLPHGPGVPSCHQETLVFPGFPHVIMKTRMFQGFACHPEIRQTNRSTHCSCRRCRFSDSGPQSHSRAPLGRSLLRRLHTVATEGESPTCMFQIKGFRCAANIRSAHIGFWMKQEEHTDHRIYCM